MSSLVLGCDPGIRGALAWYNRNTRRLEHVFDMPTLEYKMASGKIRRRLDLMRLAIELDTYAAATSFAMVEDVGPMPNDGPVQAFKFGLTVGETLAMLTAFAVPIRLVKPQVWKALMGLGQDKDMSRALATRKFPEHEKLFARKKDNDRAEASLLAWFGAERFV